MKISPSSFSISQHHSKVFSVGGISTLNLSSDALALTLNAISVADGGMLWGGRKNADGNYYTITFPDDFVSEVNSSEIVNGVAKDPFKGYRSKSSPYPIDISDGLDVTIQIPPGMQLGANSHRAHVHYGIIASGFGNYSVNDETHQGSVGNVPGENLNSWGYQHDASADPCIILDLYTKVGPYSEGSAKVTASTLGDLNITIENYGNTIGGGGIGGQGGKHTKTNQTSGGGGGGGAGIHQAVSTFTDPNDRSALWTALDSPQRQVATASVLAPPLGAGGRGGSYHPDITTQTGTAANGTQGDSALGTPGIGGAGDPHNNDLSSGGAIAPGRGAWGGSVVYLRCNGYEIPGTHGPFSEKITGTTVNIINKSTGRMYGGGGGGGAGDRGKNAGDGGPLGSNGAYGVAAAVGGEITFGGSAGAILHWNTSTIVPANTIVNESSFDIKGRDILVPGV